MCRTVFVAIRIRRSTVHSRAVVAARVILLPLRVRLLPLSELLRSRCILLRARTIALRACDRSKRCAAVVCLLATIGRVSRSKCRPGFTAVPTVVAAAIEAVARLPVTGATPILIATGPGVRSGFPKASIAAPSVGARASVNKAPICH